MESWIGTKQFSLFILLLYTMWLLFYFFWNLHNELLTWKYRATLQTLHLPYGPHTCFPFYDLTNPVSAIRKSQRQICILSPDNRHKYPEQQWKVYAQVVIWNYKLKYKMISTKNIYICVCQKTFVSGGGGSKLLNRDIHKLCRTNQIQKSHSKGTVR